MKYLNKFRLFILLIIALGCSQKDNVTGSFYNCPETLTLERMSIWSVKLTWLDRSENEDGFYIYRMQPGEEDMQLIAEVESNETTYIDTLTSVNGRVYYKVSAFNGSNTSNYATSSIYVNLIKFSLNYAQSIYTHGDYMYACNNSAFTIYRINDLEKVMIYSPYNWKYSNYSAFAASDDYLVNVPNGKNIVLFNNTFQEYPIRIFSRSFGIEDIYDVEIKGDYVIIASKTGLYFLNLLYPTGPKIETSFLSGTKGEIEIKEDNLYWANNNLTIIDISDLANPNIIGEYDVPISQHFQLEDNYIYSLAGAGISVINLNDLDNPCQIILNDQVLYREDSSYYYKEGYLYTRTSESVNIYMVNPDMTLTKEKQLVFSDSEHSLTVINKYLFTVTYDVMKVYQIVD